MKTKNSYTVMKPGRTRHGATRSAWARGAVRRPISAKVDDSGWFYNLRKQLDVSRRDIAERSGLGLKTLEKWEALDFYPTMKSLQRVADAFDMDVYVEFRPKVKLEDPTWQRD